MNLILKMKNKDALADNVAPGLDTVGIRIPDHWFSMIANILKIPLVTTSANVVGDNFMTSMENCSKVLNWIIMSPTISRTKLTLLIFTQR